MRTHTPPDSTERGTRRPRRVFGATKRKLGSAIATVGCALAALIGLGALTACSRTGSGDTAESKSPTYALTGEVLAVDTKANTIRVRHEDIKGLMPAMTMDFSASAAEVNAVKPGEKIRAQLVETHPGEFHLEQIYPNDRVADDTVAAVSRELAEDTSTRGRNAYREIGETVPDFALYDQTGHVVQLSRFRGKQIMLNFIYTRCPVANMCPAATVKMTQTQRLAREAHVDNLELISITLDPKYDSPAVLNEYARTRGIDTSNFSFLTGPEKAIKDLLAQFGVIAEFQGPLLNHTLATLLIDENGKIVWRADGSQWEPKDFVAKMHHA